MTLVITPSAPRPTTAPSKCFAVVSRESFHDVARRGDHFERGYAVDRLPFFSPEPWVAVVQAPATEICGSDARLCRAKPLRRDRAQLAVGDARIRPSRCAPRDQAPRLRSSA